ncbi:unnamed protein product, partial [Ectocarpus sp. 12 AP-2014]
MCTSCLIISSAGASSKRQRKTSSPEAKEQCGGSGTSAPHKPVIDTYDLHTLRPEATVLPRGRLHNVVIVRQCPQPKGGVLLKAYQTRNDRPRQQAVRPSRLHEAPVIW